MSERAFLNQFGLWLMTVMASTGAAIFTGWLFYDRPNLALVMASYALFRTFKWRSEP